jgi:hypothetical protein
MFRSYDITEEQRDEINIWADSVIETNKQAMSSGKAYLLWSDSLYYQPGKDTWVDEGWWIKTAKELFLKHKDDYDGMGTAVIPALEILVRHFPQQYTEFSRDKIDRWFDRSYHDPEYWWDLIVAVYPDHPATQCLFEQQDNARESNIAIKLGDTKTAIGLKDNILSDLEDGEIYFMCEFLKALDISIFSKLFSFEESDKIKSTLLGLAKKELPLHLEKFREYTERDSILSIAIIMKWQEIVDALKNNANYLERLLDEFKQSSTHILLWSKTDNHVLTENLAFQLYPEIHALNRIHQLSFPSHEFSLAIAWKRSQSKA